MKESIIWNLLKQITAIISFVVLAICFERWWISLFALLFQSELYEIEHQEKE